jgi:YegS/Rv2252/BmrU family lipid kinase
MRKILFIINPISGTGKQKKLTDAIHIAFESADYEYKIVFSEYLHHGSEIAAEAVHQNYDTIVAAGGDGSINDVANQLIHTDISLGIIPIGSGNGLAHFLKIPFGIQKSLETIKKNKTLLIDTVKVNSGTFEKFFTSIAGIGFDALVAKKFAKSKNRGLNAYLNIILTDYPLYEPKTYKMVIDNMEKIESTALLLSFANSNQFGYNAVIAPNCSITDGYIDIIIAEKVPVMVLPLLTPLLWTKNLDYSSYIKYIKAKKIRILNNNDRCMNIDGESYSSEEEITLENIPHSLKVIIA